MCVEGRCPIRGGPGRFRDGAGQDLEALKLPLALLIYHIYFFPKRANFAIFKSMYVCTK